MVEEEKLRLFQDTIDLWGVLSQLEMLQEEATELALAARKVIRNPEISEFRNLASEVADVEIMLEQLKIMYPGIIEAVELEKELKLTRLRKRVDEKRFESNGEEEK